MKFKVSMKNKTYWLNIVESSTEWEIQLLEDDLKKETLYNVSKKDFVELPGVVSFIFKNKSHVLHTTKQGDKDLLFCKGSYRTLSVLNEEELLRESISSNSALSKSSNIVSGMPGKIVKIYAKVGNTYKQGEPLLVIEAMKMENEIQAPSDVCVKNILVKENDNIESGAKLIVFK
ncbi:MAG: acetyl-CoA carboxylase biotin carboxyl carrier protein subunit [Bdellovibrionaceae bacterium]|nr:acetyl-CoA carboxylase biotin carboxyl carrier protein subunit [Pseudobdellovibrionaceae bacterium]